MQATADSFEVLRISVSYKVRIHTKHKNKLIIITERNMVYF